MSSGAGVDNFYTKFGSNEEDLIFLAAVVSPSDDAQDIISTYQQRSGITPTFPIVLYRDGGIDLAHLFTMPNYGGVQWMCHPKLFYDQISSYSESALTNAANAALADDCVGTYIMLHNKAPAQDVQIFNNKLILSTDAAEKVTIKVISLNGQTVYSAKQDLSKGVNRVSMNSSDIVKGLYILEIIGSSGLHYCNKVMIQ